MCAPSERMGKINMASRMAGFYAFCMYIMRKKRVQEKVLDLAPSVVLLSFSDELSMDLSEIRQ